MVKVGGQSFVTGMKGMPPMSKVDLSLCLISQPPDLKAHMETVISGRRISASFLDVTFVHDLLGSIWLPSAVSPRGVDRSGQVWIRIQ